MRFGRVRRGSAGLNKLAKQLDGGAAVCSDPRSGLRSLRRFGAMRRGLVRRKIHSTSFLGFFFLKPEWIKALP